MPELPEVQTVVSQLGNKLTGDSIEDIWTDWPKAVRSSLARLKRSVSGAKIIGTRRLGKHVVIDLDNGKSLVIHLKMTGHLLVKTPKNRLDAAFQDPYNQFIHHIIFLSQGKTVEFSDMRKFGWMEVADTKKVEELSSIQTLGVDALSAKLTVDRFREILDKRKKRPIGSVLLEQQLIAGIGNIYRSEALFHAGILPTRTVESLTEEEAKRLLQSVKLVLRRAIRYRGTSDGDFRDTDGMPGGFQRVLGVYGQAGKPCPKCGTILQRIKLGQRSAFFCSHCQH